MRVSATLHKQESGRGGRDRHFVSIQGSRVHLGKKVRLIAVQPRTCQVNLLFSGLRGVI